MQLGISALEVFLKCYALYKSTFYLLTYLLIMPALCHLKYLAFVQDRHLIAIWYPYESSTVMTLIQNIDADVTLRALAYLH